MENFEFLTNFNELAFFMLIPGQPYIPDVSFGQFPADFKNALKRAYNKEEVPLAELMPGREMAKICTIIYEKYSDQAHNSRLAQTEKEAARKEDIYKRSQMFEH